MSQSLRRRLDRLTPRARSRAPITDEERRRRWFAMNPEGSPGAREELAARIDRLERAASDGDEGAAAQLERVMAACTEILNRREESNP